MRQVPTLTILATLAAALVHAVPVPAELQPAVPITRLQARSPAPGPPRSSGKGKKFSWLGGCCGGGDDAVSQAHTPTRPAYTVTEVPDHSPVRNWLDRACCGDPYTISEAGHSPTHPSYSVHEGHTASNHELSSDGGDEGTRARQTTEFRAVNPDWDRDRDSHHSSDSNEQVSNSHDSKSSRSSGGAIDSDDHNDDAVNSYSNLRNTHLREGKRIHDTFGRRKEQRTRFNTSRHPLASTRPVFEEKKHRTATHSWRRHDSNRTRDRKTRTRVLDNKRLGGPRTSSSPRPILAITEHGETSAGPSHMSGPLAPPVSRVDSFNSIHTVKEVTGAGPSIRAHVNMTSPATPVSRASSASPSNGFVDVRTASFNRRAPS